MRIKQKIFSFLNDKLVWHAAVVLLGTALVGFINLVYHLVSVRMLTTEDYGTFNSLISLTTFFIMSLKPLGISFTRFFAEYAARDDYIAISIFFSKILKKLFLMAFLFIGTVLAFSGAIAEFLRTEQVYVIICGGIVILSLFSKAVLTLFQGIQKFKTYSGIWAASAFCKLAWGILLMSLGLRVIGGLSGFLAESGLIIVISLFFLPGILKKKTGRTDRTDPDTVSLAPVYRHLLPAFVAMFSLTLLTHIDVILVKHFFSPLEAGYYSIAQVAGKITFFLSSALAIVILPKSTEAFVNNKPSLKLLYKSLLMGGACISAVVGAAFLFPEAIINAIAGKANPVSRSLVGIFSLAMGFYALLWITINYSLAVHNFRFVLPLFCIALINTVTIYHYHPTLVAVLYILFTSSMISFFLTLLITRNVETKKYSVQKWTYAQ